MFATGVAHPLRLRGIDRLAERMRLQLIAAPEQPAENHAAMTTRQDARLARRHICARRCAQPTRACMECRKTGLSQETCPLGLRLEESAREKLSTRSGVRIVAVPDQDEIAIHNESFTYTTMMGV